MKFFTSLFLIPLIFIANAAASDNYHLTKTIAIPDDGGWDYLNVDSDARTVYMSHGTEVVAIDADSGELKGKILDTPGVHGVALAYDLGRGFTSNGKTGTVTIFDLKTLKKLGEIKAEKNPDAIIYDSYLQRVFVFNGGSSSATVFNAADGKLLSSVALGGKPEFAVSDGAGKIFVNLEDKSEILTIDAKTLNVMARWPLTPGEEPSSLAIDVINHRLFVGCHNKMQLVVNADNGKIITTMSIGESVDATTFDPETKLIFTSNGEGTVTIIRQESADIYKVIETLKTKKGSRTLALDKKTHRLFIPAAQFRPAATPTADNPKPRPTIISGRLAVLVFDKTE